MRAVLSGRPGGTSVPSVHASPPSAPDPRWNSGGAAAGAAPAQGGSFLGTAAASAAGVIGGALLLNSISSMFGHHNNASAFAAVPREDSPWNNNAAGSDLARDAGINDIGAGSQPSGLLDDSEADSAGLSEDNGGFDGSDFGGGDFGGGGDSA